MYTQRRIHRILLSAAVIFSLWLTSCGAPTPPPPPFGPVLHIGIQSDQPGWGFNEKQGRSGFDYDLANWIATKRNAKVAFVELSPQDRTGALEAGAVDMVIATYSRTDLRDQRVGFAGPYVRNHKGFLVKDGDPIANYDDLRGKAVCAATGTTAALELAVDKNLVLTEAPGAGNCLDLLREGKVSAMATDQLILHGLAQKNPGFRVVENLPYGKEERYGIGLPLVKDPVLARARCEEVTRLLREFLTDSSWEGFFHSNLSSVSNPAQYKPNPNFLDPCK